MAFSLFKKTEKTEKKEQPKPGPHYHDLTVKKIIQETKDAITIVFEQPPTKINYKSGQFLTLIATINGKDVRRAYSLCSSPFVDTDLAVTVKRVENGLMSNWLPDNLKPGMKMKVMEPMGQFTTEFSKNNKRHLVLFGGGSGITPMMSIIKSVLSQEPDSICSLIYCNRDIDSIIFKEEFTQMETQDEGRLEKLFERIPDWGIDKTTYLMCGPEGMMKNVETLLAEHNIPKEKIFKESFVQGTIDKAVKSEPVSNELRSREVTIRYDNQEFKITVPPTSTILFTALDQGIDLPYSCQSGLCTACRGKAISGIVKLDEEEGLSKSERDEGYVLTCVGHPMSDDVVIEIG
jgi:ring-1,2-phenylacetyl-CoA epoxidase subunit PaaE